jgi:hypothetical protein
MENVVDEIVRALAHDLSVSEPSLTVVRGTRDGCASVELIDAEAGGVLMSWWGDTSPPPRWIAADVCGQVQDAVIDHLNRAWPVCPIDGHQHPLVSMVNDERGVATWRCPPSEDEWSIGMLPEATP